MSKPELFPGVPMPEHPRYTVIEKLAQGDYATVFRARDAELHREVAIKQIHAQYLEDPRQLEGYWREAQLIASLEHPRIMTIYDIVRERGWLILELMMGNISEVLKGRAIDLTDLRYLLKAAAQALQFLERNGIVHGDVKPSNLLVDRNRLIKLGDFGIARRLSRGEGSVVKGTAKYMAPEVVSDQFGPVGPHSDLYSLGFSAYELMCGQHFETLFPGLNMFGRDRQIAWMMWQSAPDRRLPSIARVLQNVPDDLAMIVEKLCEKDAAKRYRTAEEVLRDLDDDKTRSRKPTAQEAAEAAKGANQARRKRMLAVGALAVSLLLSIVMALLPGGGGDGEVEDPNLKVPEPVRGTYVLVDPANRRLQLQTAAGAIQEVSFDQERDTIVLNGRELLRSSELKDGDWLEATPVLSAGALVQWRIAVERAESVETRGMVAEVRSASQTVTVAPEGDAGRPLNIFVPSTVNVLLNGEAVSLDAIKRDDRIMVTYLPGREKLQAEAIAAQRQIRLEGQIEAIRLPSQVIVRLADSSVFERTVDADCQVVLTGRTADADGRMFSLSDLRKDDRVSIEADRMVRRIEAQRVMTVAGKVERADPQTRQIRIQQPDGRSRTLSLHEDCTVQLDDGESVNFAELRTDDAVTIIEDAQDGRARSIQAVFAPDRDVWAAIIAQSRYKDERMAPTEAAQQAAELLRRTLSRRVRVPDDQLLWLVDSTEFDIGQRLAEFLRRLPRDARLIVYFAGHAAKDEEGGVYLAARDFDPTRPKDTGLDLAKLLRDLDDAGQTTSVPGAGAADAPPIDRKILLFDVQYGGQDRQWQPSAEELLEAIRARQGGVSRSVSVIGNTSRGQVDFRPADAQAGIFATAVAAAYQGKADFDGDQQVSPQELFKFLRVEILSAAQRASRDQMPVLFEPNPIRFTPEQRKAMLELLAPLKEKFRIDKEFNSKYYRAVELIPDQPAPHLAYCLALLQGSTSSKTATDELQKVAAKFPDHSSSVVAYHGLAWLQFRSGLYDRGLQNLSRAVSLAPSGDHPYSRRLFAFAGQLSGFAYYVVADERSRSGIPELRATVEKRGEPALQTFLDAGGQVREKANEYDKQIQGTDILSEKRSLEQDKRNVNLYGTFDVPAAVDYLRKSLGDP